MGTEDEAIYTAVLKELAAVIAKLDRARRRCADLEAQMDEQITWVEEFRRRQRADRENGSIPEVPRPPEEGS